ncbi:carbohydrate ABC transporter permease [Rathayibacter sp. VKM Ac-2927]|uniref:carbohydrate ABC transporter permease n=1 Tax=Rathayibacter sp. VKM Ac-2927 TaxID=2929478 RepID=UPI001FB53AF3|nr:sugar ABC transporter permease [Rathayibacter sp. VKM Ac-2927]MCJ1688355.1 sugar ABC transporter permease [Rathayibacter sp. VKM Ac-2927]
MTNASVQDLGVSDDLVGATPPPPSARMARRGSRRPAMRASGLPWILPALVISGGIIYFCIGYNGYVATLDWNGVSPNPQSVGLDNFARALADPIFWGTIQHTALYFVVTFVVQTVLGILFAVLLHSKIRFAVLYKVVIFIPVVLAPAIMAPVFRIMFAGEGPVNELLQAIGLGFLAQPWLAQSSTALGVLMIMQVWQSTGISFILYYSAMSQIDTEIIEAARIDGAGNIRVIWSIIVPGIKGTVVALAMLTAIASLKLFDIPYLVTLGGPNYATEFLGTYIYRQAVPLGDVGYAAALSVLLLILALAMAIILSARNGDKKERNS